MTRICEHCNKTELNDEEGDSCVVCDRLCCDNCIDYVAMREYGLTIEWLCITCGPDYKKDSEES